MLHDSDCHVARSFNTASAIENITAFISSTMNYRFHLISLMVWNKSDLLTGIKISNYIVILLYEFTVECRKIFSPFWTLYLQEFVNL